MSKRKNHGYGLKERSPNHWAIIIEDKDRVTGKRKRAWHSFNGSRTEAKVEARRLLAEKDAGKRVDPSKITVAAFLDRWLDHMKGQVSPRSHERYAELAQKNLMPLLGSIRLSKLHQTHISEAYAKALSSGRRDGSGGLSARTVTHMHRVLRQALQQALLWNMVGRNVADLVKAPGVERKQMSVLDADDTANLIEAARTSPFIHSDPARCPLRPTAGRDCRPPLAQCPS
jgi:hypothetical protein